eukprot:1763046-Pyramimonas_sp.AAC.1
MHVWRYISCTSRVQYLTLWCPLWSERGPSRSFWGCPGCCESSDQAVKGCMSADVCDRPARLQGTLVYAEEKNIHTN